jgi:hypothetical protein
MRNRKLVTLVTVALAIVLGSGMALADDLNLGGSYNGGIIITGGYLHSGTASEGGGSIGPSKLNGYLLPWVYCVDLPDTVNVPADYPNAVVTHDGTIAGSQANSTDGGIAGYTSNGALATVSNAVQVAWLAHTFAAGASGYDAQVGLQAAIWHEIYGVSLCLTCGNSPGAVTDYNFDIAALIAAGSLPNYVGDFAWLSPNGNDPNVMQGLLTPIPDGGMTLMLLGGTLVGVGTLRRKFRA